MKAIVFDGRLRCTDDHPEPDRGEKEALVRVRVAGICDTDLQITMGYMGFQGILGHEFVGIVEQVPGENKALLGKRVVGDINCGCGVCGWCLSGLGHHCPARTTLGISGRDGAFAEHIALPPGNLMEVPASVPDEAAVFTEPLAAAFEVAEGVHIKPSHKVLVLGDGKLGILIALVLRNLGAELILGGKHDDKLGLAQDLGLRGVNVSRYPPDRSCDIVVDATGSSAGFKTALGYVRPKGTIVLKTTAADDADFNLAPVVVHEIKVVGSRCGPFEPALRALSRGEIDVRPLITAIYPFSKAREAFERAARKDSLKVLLDFR